MRQYGKRLSEEDIQEIMRTGKHERLPQKYQPSWKNASELMWIRFIIFFRHGYNLEVTEIVFVGGGAAVMKRFGNYDGNNVHILRFAKMAKSI